MSGGEWCDELVFEILSSSTAEQCIEPHPVFALQGYNTGGQGYDNTTGGQGYGGNQGGQVCPFLSCLLPLPLAIRSGGQQTRMLCIHQQRPRSDNCLQHLFAAAACMLADGTRGL